ncbi:CoA-acylating methylmalonate-semialdehyde dehydrogenase [Candidatus Korarchaeum cryptofilum]|jgi:malonate-semialdehyde dehydrogenase (acetylating)/methylmalonate-semialdehyde dehydrogenase|uniref:Aldehyde dehydrogenase n=2 Tax=Candidatus Korarchaeum cryptofilum TaxID=498846 RepID=B1L471_KORCO|nr:CoA-acylating methylmalonate-semialdehyde dehydrogenase [Candidatus Korarchaeum cryptofilum]ACB07250.1 aldehyde dehydrogenase [Candidatus Korarchaeum cryptofilum OPF8]RSN68016.1 CoA-acylating methylmalonate-semialdehyde dehydrogenase [Candidatus Korarchaeum cryptofilum]
MILEPPRSDYGVLKLFINGKWVESSSREYAEVYDPGLGKVIAKVPMATEAEVDEAVEAAYEAFKSWSKLPVPDRLQYIFKMKYAMEERKEIIARANTQNHGKVIRESRGDLRRSIENVEAAISVAYTLAKGEYQQEIAKGVDEVLIREPLGVFAVVSPYNFPVMIPFWFIPYALALGDTLVVKVSSTTPVPMVLVMEALASELPPGVLNVIYSDHKVGEHLVTHPLVEGTAFVGTSNAALRLYELSASKGKRFLGGGSAANYAVVMPDADLERTVHNLRDSKFGNTGQRCLAIQNIVLVGDIYDKFKEQFLNLAKEIRIGYGLDERSEMGPMASRKYRDNVIKMIEEGLKEGAKLALDGRGVRVEEYPDGFYLGPTVLEGVTPDMKVAREEIFGPVANLLRADSLDQAIEWINKNKYHHSASIFTRSGKYAREFLHNVYVGNVGINIGIAAPVGWFPFGGKRLAGVGSHHPQMDAVDFFTDRKVGIVRWF